LEIFQDIECDVFIRGGKDERRAPLLLPPPLSDVMDKKNIAKNPALSSLQCAIPHTCAAY
jgi:hypothetical protein